MKRLFLSLILLAFLPAFSFACEKPSSIGGKILSFVNSSGELEFVTFFRESSKLKIQFRKGVDLSKKQNCPYEKTLAVTLPEGLSEFGSYVFSENTKIQVQYLEDGNPIFFLKKGETSELNSYDEKILLVSPSSSTVFQGIDFSTLSPKVNSQIVKIFDGKLFAFGGKNNSGAQTKIRRFFDPAELEVFGSSGWVQKTPSFFPSGYEILESFQKEDGNLLFVLKKNLQLYLYQIGFDPTQVNPFSDLSLSPTSLGLDFLASSSFSYFCDSVICKLASQTGDEISIFDLNTFEKEEKTLEKSFDSGQIFLSKDGVSFSSDGDFSYSAYGSSDFIKNSFFSETEENHSCEPSEDFIPEIELDLLAGEEGQNKIYTYTGRTQPYCFANKKLFIKTKSSYGPYLRVKHECVTGAGCDRIKFFAKAFMPFEFVYSEPRSIETKPIFTFSADNNLELTGNFDFGDKKLLGFFGRKEDENFKGFNKEELDKIFYIEDRELNLIKDHKGTSDIGDDGVKFDSYPSYGFHTGSLSVGKITNPDGVLDYSAVETGSGGYWIGDNFSPGANRYHLVFFLSEKNENLEKIIRANIRDGFGGGFPAYGRWKGEKQELGSDPFSTDPTATSISGVSSDNYKVYYYSLVYEIFVPKFTNLKSDSTLSGFNQAFYATGATSSSETFFFSGYSKKPNKNQDISTYTSNLTRLNDLSLNTPLFSWEEGLPKMSLQNTPFSNKTYSDSSGNFHFQSLAPFFHLEGETLANLQRNQNLKNLSFEEKASYKISSLYKDKYGNLIGSKPLTFKSKKAGGLSLFHQLKNQIYYTDSKKPLISGSFAPSKLLFVELDGQKIYFNTGEDGLFSFYLPLKSSKLSLYPIKEAYTELEVTKLKVQEEEKNSPEIVFPKSGDQFFVRYLPFQLNGKPNSKVYFKLFKLENGEQKDLREFDSNFDKDGNLTILNEKEFSFLGEGFEISSYTLLASYDSDFSSFSRTDFQVKITLEELLQKLSTLGERVYLTPKVYGDGDDIFLDGDLKKFEFAKDNFSILKLRDGQSYELTGPVSLLLEPYSSLEILDFESKGEIGLASFVGRGAFVQKASTQKNHLIFTPGIVSIGDSFLQKSDKILSAENPVLIQFFDKKIKVKSDKSFAVLNKGESEVSTTDKISFDFSNTEFEVNAFCDGINSYLKSTENYFGKIIFDGNLSREKCLTYANLYTKSLKKPFLISPKTFVKDGEKLKLFGVFRPSEKIAVNLNGQNIGTTTCDSDGFFTFSSTFLLDKNQETLNLKLTSLDQIEKKSFNFILNFSENLDFSFEKKMTFKESFPVLNLSNLNSKDLKK